MNDNNSNCINLNSNDMNDNNSNDINYNIKKINNNYYSILLSLI